MNRFFTSLKPLLPGLRRTAVLALSCNLGLELVRLLEVDGEPWRYKTLAFVPLFLLGSLVVWVVVGLVHAVLGRFRYTVAVMVIVTGLLAFADWKKVNLRGEPLYPIDWSLADELGSWQEMAGPVTTILAVIIAVGAVVVSAVLAWFLRRKQRLAARAVEDPARRRRRLLTRVAAAVICLQILTEVANFNDPGNPVRAGFESVGATWRPWSQQRNYLGNGFVTGYLYNLEVPTMPAPAGYSAGEMARIASTYERAADRINRTRDPNRLDDVNVVMVLSESFSDPTGLRGVHLAQDPIPRIRQIMGSTTSGRMLSQNLGGGTANMEFEAVTGMSMGLMPPQQRVPYLMLVPQFETFPSAVEWIERVGHRTMAIHPFTTEMYRRIEVYRAFGFDEFVHDDTMSFQKRIGHDGYLSDESAYDELVMRIKRTDEPLFVNLVTMQNHIPYSGRYPNPVRATGPDGEPMDDIGQYVRGLTYTDQATRSLLTRLELLDEPTVLVFYGDHLPGVYPQDVIRGNSKRSLHETPFFVWSSEGGSATPATLTSPAFFMDLALERAGMPIPPYYALMHELRQEIPALAWGKLFDASGHRIRRRHLSEHAKELLHDFTLVQYDLTTGSRYSEPRMFGGDTTTHDTTLTVEP